MYTHRQQPDPWAGAQPSVCPAPAPLAHRLGSISGRPANRFWPIRVRPWLWVLLVLLLGLLVSTGFGVRLLWPVSAGLGCYSVAEQGTAPACALMWIALQSPRARDSCA